MMPRVGNRLSETGMTGPEILNFVCEILQDKGALTAREISDELLKKGKLISAARVSTLISRNDKYVSQNFIRKEFKDYEIKKVYLQNYIVYSFAGGREM